MIAENRKIVITYELFKVTLPLKFSRRFKFTRCQNILFTGIEILSMCYVQSLLNKLWK